MKTLAALILSALCLAPSAAQVGSAPSTPGTVLIWRSPSGLVAYHSHDVSVTVRDGMVHVAWEGHVKPYVTILTSPPPRPKVLKIQRLDLDLRPTRKFCATVRVAWDSLY